MNFSFYIGNYLVQINLWAVLLSVFLLSIPVWIVYRPDKKIAKRFGFASQGEQKIDLGNRQENLEHWNEVKKVFDKESPQTWRQGMKLVEVMFDERLLNKLNPENVSQLTKVDSLAQKDSFWLNAYPAKEIKDRVLHGELNQISFYQIEEALEKFEKIFEEVGFI